MCKHLFSFLLFMGLWVGTASAQTLLHEGKGSFLSTTPAALFVFPENGLNLGLNASYARRLSDRFDVSGAAGYVSSTLHLGAGAGYTNRFGGSPWGIRTTAGLAANTLIEGSGHVTLQGGIGASVFREIGLTSNLNVFPNINASSDVLIGPGDADLLYSAGIGVTAYYRVWREIRLFVSPSFTVVGLSSNNFTEDYAIIGFGAQLRINR